MAMRTRAPGLRTGTRTASQKRNETIYQEIRYRICTNRYPPDTVLSEEELAGEYAISRSPIRRVFSRLEHEGLVEIRHGYGTVVTRIEPEQLAEVYAVRLVLAEAMAPFIEMPVDPAMRQLIMECAEQFRALEPGDCIGFAENNIRYYITGVTGLGSNAVLRDLQRNLFFQTSRMWLMLLPEMPWQETIDAVYDECLEVVRRMDIGDPTGLSYSIRNHIFEGQGLLLRALEKRRG